MMELFGVRKKPVSHYATQFLQPLAWGFVRLSVKFSRPISILTLLRMQADMLHLAILHRQENVFSLVKKMDSFLWEWKAAPKHEQGHNVLHLTAELVISSQVSGAALQMQRELQWFTVIHLLN